MQWPHHYFSLDILWWYNWNFIVRYIGPRGRHHTGMFLLVEDRNRTHPLPARCKPRPQGRSLVYKNRFFCMTRIECYPYERGTTRTCFMFRVWTWGKAVHNANMAWWSLWTWNNRSLYFIHKVYPLRKQIFICTTAVCFHYLRIPFLKVASPASLKEVCHYSLTGYSLFALNFINLQCLL
jgi:hypothetical protein